MPGITVQSSGLLTAGSDTLRTGAAILSGVTLLEAAAASEITVWDNTAGEGTVVANLKGGVNNSSKSEDYAIPVKCSTGIYYTISGAGAEAVIRWAKLL